ncbi:hypothetical protein VCHA52P456_410002 [Vibrio chagasii]|nr:hypothetical protein VCHA52P456_410002 [Vibrio chagasii]
MYLRPDAVNHPVKIIYEVVTVWCVVVAYTDDCNYVIILYYGKTEVMS